MSVYHSIRSSQAGSESFVNLDLGADSVAASELPAREPEPLSPEELATLERRRRATSARFDRHAAAESKKVELARKSQMVSKETILICICSANPSPPSPPAQVPAAASAALPHRLDARQQGARLSGQRSAATSLRHAALQAAERRQQQPQELLRSPPKTLYIIKKKNKKTIMAKENARKSVEF